MDNGFAATLSKRFEEHHAALHRADRQGARQALERLLVEAPGQPTALNSLGLMALNEGRVEEAERLFLDACTADPAAPELWMNVATARRRRGDDPGERDALMRVLDRDQRHLGGLLRLAELHERRGEMSLAMLRWSQVLELARGVDAPAPAFLDRLAHARTYIQESGRRLASSIEAGLNDVRGPLSVPERRRFDACIDRMFGRRQIYQNQCHGLHFPFLPADEFFDRDLFPWMDALEAHTPAIRADAEMLLREGTEGVVPYVSMEPGSPPTKWTPLNQSPDWSVFYLWRFGQRDDEHARRCPATMAALQSVPLAEMGRRTPNVFFSILKPRTRLPAHTGVSNARAIVHLPLIVPPGCGFRVGGETREWQEGRAFAFDDTIEHEAWNDSDQPRVVLILDIWNPHLTSIERQLLARYFDVADAAGFDPRALATVAD